MYKPKLLVAIHNRSILLRDSLCLTQSSFECSKLETEHCEHVEKLVAQQVSRDVRL